MDRVFEEKGESRPLREWPCEVGQKQSGGLFLASLRAAGLRRSHPLKPDNSQEGSLPLLNCIFTQRSINKKINVKFFPS